MIGADIKPTDIVSHDDKDVWSALLLLLRSNWRARHHCSDKQGREAEPEFSPHGHRQLLPSLLFCGRPLWTPRFAIPIL
jgi:hypothetical protein